MTSIQFHRDNHFVPCVYLKGWAGADGKIATYRLLVPHEKFPLWRRYTPTALAYHAYLYTQTISGAENDDIEIWLDREFEKPAEEPLRKARTGARMSYDDWKQLIRFVAAQDVRTPAYYWEQAKRADEQFPELMQTTIETVIREREESGKIENPAKLNSLPTEEREGLPLKITVERDPSGGGQIRAEILRGRRLWHWTIQRHLTKNVRVLLQHRWTILAPAKGLTWFTSDNPVVRLNFNSLEDYNFKGGWGSIGTEIFLPLDSEHLLFTHIGPERARQRGERMTRAETELIRRFTAEHAWRLILAQDRENQMEEIRSRTVDRDIFDGEREQWSNWHRQQTEAEREFEK
jgi:hypothetical protein